MAILFLQPERGLTGKSGKSISISRTKLIFSFPISASKYSNAHTKIGTFDDVGGITSSGSGVIHMSNRNPVGLVIGCTLTTGKFFMLNIEGRLIDEEAGTIVGDFRF